MFLSIKPDAIFVADSHFNNKNQELLTFLKKVESKKILTSQLFLMGDMIDFISGESRYFVKKNSVVINLLNTLSNEIEIIYLEGNHDYNLKNLFLNIQVIKRENQPLFAKFEEKTVAISHGDNFINWKYDLYCKFIRNTIFLRVMNFLDINFFISKKIENALLSKNICHKMNNFEHIVKRRLENYNTNIVIEGHYHQGVGYYFDKKEYINIPSLCCQKKYMRISKSGFHGEEI
ncbi:MAG: UDP-2,3-diacylglucosamine diphosphatase [Campylobacterales bacterium]|nr:UDP-2,3-diacylglucosamine diphosphatase [Campylobacterales bacterium]